MTESHFHLSEFMIAKPEGRSTLRVFAASPTPLEEKNLGRLFAILEIDSIDSVNNMILDVIVAELNAHFYQSQSFELEAAFEYALQNTNRKIQELSAEIGTEWLSDFNVLVGVQKEKTVIFTNVGRVLALMIHKGKLIDILETAKAKTRDINPVKVFNNILVGEITHQGTLFFATETLLDYLSKEKIKRLLVDKTPTETIQEFQLLLGEDTSGTNFAALLFSVEAATLSAAADSYSAVANPYGRGQKGASDSMTALVSKEQQTEELLSASLWPSIKKGLKQLSGTAHTVREPNPQDAEDTYTAIDETTEDDVLQPRTTPQRASLQQARQQTSRTTQSSSAVGVAKKIGSMLFNGLVAVLSILKMAVEKSWRAIAGMIKGQRAGSAQNSSRHQRSSMPRSSISHYVAGYFARLVRWFKKLSLLQKVFVLVAVLFLVIFAQTVINTGESKKDTLSSQESAETMSHIDVKINEGKAALLYDKDAARKLFIEARALLDSIPKSSKVYKERGEEVARVLAEQLKIVNNVITLNEPTKALDYTSIKPDIQIGRMMLLGASVYAFDAKNISVYRGNLENQGTTVTISKGDGSRTFAAVSKASPGTGVAALTDDTFAIFNPIDEALNPLALEYQNTDLNIADIRLFGTRLYTLDTKNNQIFRHQKAGESFGAAEAWVTGSGVDLSNAVSFAIDGSIYVLKNNGNVIKLAGGKKDDAFTLADADPQLTSGEKIVTDENTSNIYILDAKNKRVVVYGKDGKFIAQYTSDTFDALTDMVVDEANGVIYLLNKAAIYTVDIQK